MKFLVTGGAGFIGSNFVQYLTQNSSNEVIVLDALTYASSPEALQELTGQASLVRGNILDSALVEDLTAEVDTVVHFAAETHNDNSLTDPLPFIETNVLGTFVLLEAVRKTGRRFHHISTDEVFGDLPLTTGQKFTESSPYKPSSPYSASKAGGDHLVRAWIRSHGVKATISNSSNNFGPWQHVEKFIPRQVTALLCGEMPKLYGSGAQVRDWIHVDDHSSAVLAIIEKGRPGETYLIGANGERTNLEVLRLILELTGNPESHFEHVSDRPGHDQRYAIDSRKLRTELGWSPRRRTFEQNLLETIQWYEKNESWWLDKRTASEKRYRETEAQW